MGILGLSPTLLRLKRVQTLVRRKAPPVLVLPYLD